MRKFSLPIWFGFGALVFAFPSPAGAQDEPTTWAQHVWVGPQVAFNIHAKFSFDGAFPISSSQPGPAGVSGVDHFYHDGYVRVDQTGNAQGYTSFWGYNSAAQYDAADHALLMHSATAYSASASATREDQPYLGFELGYDTEPWHWGDAHIGLEFGFGFLPIRITDNQSLAATINQSVYSFDTGNIVLPTAPYNGGPSGIGPTIHDVATALPVNTVAGTVTGTRTLDTILYTFRLGPTVHWDFCQYFGVSASAGVALGLVSGDLKYNEQVFLPDGTSAPNSGSSGATEVVYGGFIRATALFHFNEQADLYLSAEFMPMSNANIDTPGRHAQLDLSAPVYLSAGVNWSF
jgi:hypothetical protein